MSLKQRLIAPLPPSVDPAHPLTLHWRVSNLETIVEHHHETKIDKPHMPDASWLPVIGVALALILGLSGLASPGDVKAFLKLFVGLP